MEGLVTTKEHDYLDEDKPIKNQNYCLLSFISPEDVIRNKESYYIKAFLDKFSKDMDTLFNGLKNINPDTLELIDNIKKEHNYLFDVDELDSQYKFSKSVNESDVERLYHKENNFQYLTPEFFSRATIIDKYATKSSKTKGRTGDYTNPYEN